MTPLVAIETLLDGLIGSVAGAIATILVIVATIRHDSKARALDRLDDALSKTVASADACHFAIATEGPSGLAQELFRPMLSDLTMVQTRARKTAPALSDLLRECSDQITASVDTLSNVPRSEQPLLDALVRTRVILGDWLADPTAIIFGLVDYAWFDTRLNNADPTGHVVARYPKPTVWQRAARLLGLPRRTWYRGPK